MSDMFRSEKMALCQVFIQPEAAYLSVSELGEAGCVQFRDLNERVNSFQRKFVSEVRRCDEMERKVRFIEAEAKKANIFIPEIMYDMPKAPNSKEITNIEAHLEKAENEILELSENEVTLKFNFLELTELRHVLERTENFFCDNPMFSLEWHQQFIPEDDQIVSQGRGKLAYVAGVIKRERMFSFERMLWRISRGNVFLKRSDLEEPLEDPITRHPIEKTVFVAFFQGEELQSRVRKVCNGFRASIYPCPIAHAERNEMVKGVRIRLEDLRMVLNQTKDHRNRVLTTVSKYLNTWNLMIKKMKAIYHTLNLFNMDVSKKCFIGECWVPTSDLSLVQAALLRGTSTDKSTIPSFLNVIYTDETPPTYNRTNKFTRGFQNLIDSYGIASYREVNPALYTIITFPFLFAVMFGDLGHGFIMLLFGTWMCILEKKLSCLRGGEIWNIFFCGRYIILLMGLFSLYTGFLYNDLFSKSVNIFGSAWKVHYNTSTVQQNSFLQLNPKYSYEGVYIMGLDPLWQLGANKIVFLNSFKMKLSIIFGVAHMLFGVLMSVVNYNHFRKRLNIVLEFLPQVLFLVLLFGYMVFMMFYKWAKYTAKTDVSANKPGCAPSVLIMFINMMLFKSTAPLPGCKEYMFEAQHTLQIVFIVLALICIPWMLLAKPLYVKYTRAHKKHVIQREIQIAEESENPLPNGTFSHSHNYTSTDEEEEPISEVFIHQAIHTIEYVLSTISHTASYLRLWALSLAHAQLSEVLWSRLMAQSFGNAYIFGFILFFIFATWAAFTLVILVMMEGLSAFLHTLRLHWVEFMSKFYEGTGYAFTPFSFKNIIEAEEEEQ